jgi:CBS domain-containing protein
MARRQGAAGPSFLPLEFFHPAKEVPMQAQDVMTRDVITVAPDATLEQAARLMEEADIGALPVSEDDRMVGMVTDRDIAIRAIAHGMGPQAKVREVMTGAVRYCFCDQDIEDIADNMADIQLRRLPVVDRDKRLVGILSLGDLATSDDPDPAAEALCGISRPAPAVELYPPG